MTVHVSSGGLIHIYVKMNWNLNIIVKIWSRMLLLWFSLWHHDVEYRDVNFGVFHFSIREFQNPRLVEYLKLNAAFADGPRVELTSSPLTYWELITVESWLLGLLHWILSACVTLIGRCAVTVSAARRSCDTSRSPI